MRGRRSGALPLERDIAELAEHALDAAREAGHVAAPALQHSAEGLSKAFEKAAAVFLESAERFTRAGEGRASGAAEVARERLADASERFAQSIRPKRKTHRVRNVVFAAAAIGGIVALVQSPVRARLMSRFLGPPPDDSVPDSITLPVDEPSEVRSASGRPRADVTVQAGAADGDGIGSIASVPADTQN